MSSYAWICMILNFLQTRNPPILPSLHEKSNKTINLADGKYAAFNDDIESLRGFGKQNKETLGDLFFQFFRRYAHDVDYEKNVVSVREGRLISKEAKKWHLMQNNRLCVEEPFNIDRNLGNTADDISFRGIHLELRRAFDLISEGKLNECLEEYNFPAAEEKVWEKPTPKPPAVLTRSRSQSQSSRGKSGYASRGGRHHTSNHHSKNRRASSAAATNKYPIPPNGPHAFGDRSAPSQEQLIHAQYEQLKLHRHLFDEMQTLQRQEYELRLKQAQVQLQQEMEVQASNQGHPNAPHSVREQSRRHQTPTPAAPLTAPLRGGQHFPPFMYPQVPGTPYQSVHTQPSSPSLRHAQPDLRRSIHRTSTNDSTSSANVRSHSQPARSIPVNVAMQNVPPLPMNSQQFLQYQNIRHQQQLHQDQIYYDLQGPGLYSYQDLQGYTDPRRRSVQQTFDESVPKEYAGYWINDSPPSYIYRDDHRIPRIPHNQDLYPRVRGVPPNVGRFRDKSRSPSPSPALPHRDRSFSLQSASSGPVARPRYERVQGTAPPARGPIIVNGSDTYPLPEGPPILESLSHTTTVSEATSGSDDPIYETPATAEMDPYCNGVFEDNFAIDQAHHLYQGQLVPDGLRYTHFDPRSYMEPSPRRLAKQSTENGAFQPTKKHTERTPGTGRGLNIQFGEVEYSRPSTKSEPSAPREPSRSSKNVSRIDPPPIPASNGQSEKAQISVPLLSPVREVRTPSPVGKRKELAGLSQTSNTKRTIGKMDLYIPAFSELVQARQEKELFQKSEGRTSNIGSNGTLRSTPNGIELSHDTPQTSPIRVLQIQQNAPSASSPKAMGSHSQANGWQQQASKKNKKSRSRPGSGNYPGEQLPADEAERKGG